MNDQIISGLEVAGLSTTEPGRPAFSAADAGFTLKGQLAKSQTMPGLEVADPQNPPTPTLQPAGAPLPPTQRPDVAPARTDAVHRTDVAPSAEEMSFGLAGLPDPLEVKAPSPTSKPRKTVRFVESEREKVVVLAHPVECEGFVYEWIAVRRLNVSDYIAHFAKPEGERGRFPCFFDGRGEPVPEEVLDALSLDDSTEVNEAYQHFLPASFRDDREQ